MKGDDGDIKYCTPYSKTIRVGKPAQSVATAAATAAAAAAAAAAAEASVAPFFFSLLNGCPTERWIYYKGTNYK